MLGGSLYSHLCYIGWRPFSQSYAIEWMGVIADLVNTRHLHLAYRNFSVGETDGCKLTLSLLDIYIWGTTPSENKWVQIKKEYYMHMLYVQNIRVYKVLCTKKIFVCTNYFTWFFKNLFFYAWTPLRISGSTPFKKCWFKALQDPSSKESILVNTDKQIKKF